MVDTSGYRTSDFKYYWNPKDHALFVKQIEDYDVLSPDSILQYPFLPVNTNLKDAYGIGGTPLTQMHNLGKQFNISLYVKCEHTNPSGSFKDRETLITSLNFHEKNYKIAIGFSSGNACCSAAYVAGRSNQRFIAVVSGDIYQEKLNYIVNLGIDVIQIGDEKCYFEKAYQIFCQSKNYLDFQFNEIDDWSVSNPYRVEGDKTISVEIVKQMGISRSGKYNVPDFVIFPTANGTCLSGVWKGFKELYDCGVIDKLPKMVSIGMENASPLHTAYPLKQLMETVKCNLNLMDDTNTVIGSTLVSEESYDIFNSFRSIKESKGLVYEGNANDIRMAYDTLLSMEPESMIDHDLIAEPCSILSLTAIRKMAEQGIFKSTDSAVVVFTGHGGKSKALLNKLDVHLPFKTKLEQKDDSKGNSYSHSSGNGQKGKIVRISENVSELVDKIISISK